MRKSVIVMGMVLGSCVLALSGCSLGKGKESPIFEIEESTEQSYEMTRVMRGTIQKTGILSASYAQTNQEKLRFSISGKRLAGIYVVPGSNVKKGDLLAELRMETEEAKIEECAASIEKKTLQKEQLEEQRDFQKAALQKKRWSYTTEEYQEAEEALKWEYDYRIEDLEDEIVLLGRQLEELEQQVQGSRLYAGIDGTITKLANTKGYVSDEKTDFLVISDSTVCAFLGYGAELMPYLEIGESRTFHTSDNTKEYTVVLKEKDETMGSFTFELPVPDYSIPIGQRVLCTVTMETRENVLYLPKAAVHMANEQYYVYYIDEEGIRRMKDVETGLVADEHVEILSGLSEGEEVILR